LRIVLINKPERPSSSESIFPAVAAALAERGADVQNVVPEEHLFDLSNLDTSADLYVLRTRSVVGLNLAAALEIAGARMLIPYSRERVLRNKFLLQQQLIKAAVPVPRSYLAWSMDHVRELVGQVGKVVVKPHEGHGGKGVYMVSSGEDVDNLPDLRGPLFVQEFVPNAGTDLKIYGVADHVAAIRRIFPARTPEEKRGTPVEPSSEVKAIARRCDDVLGLGLYGVDVLESERGPVVIDINSVPGYKGIEGAADRVADFIYARAAGRTPAEGVA
jgi:ribosomal protein S6--L-glutamate ligase